MNFIYGVYVFPTFLIFFSVTKFFVVQFQSRNFRGISFFFSLKNHQKLNIYTKLYLFRFWDKNIQFFLFICFKWCIKFFVPHKFISFVQMPHFFSHFLFYSNVQRVCDKFFFFFSTLVEYKNEKKFFLGRWSGKLFFFAGFEEENSSQFDKKFFFAAIGVQYVMHSDGKSNWKVYWPLVFVYFVELMRIICDKIEGHRISQLIKWIYP